MNIMGFLLLGESRVTHDTDGKNRDPVVMFTNSQAFRGFLPNKLHSALAIVFFIRMDCSPKRSDM